MITSAQKVKIAALGCLTGAFAALLAELPDEEVSDSGDFEEDVNNLCEKLLVLIQQD